MKKLIFLFSLPRSGSTLLQTLLNAHSKITSIPEPWILLPLLYILKSKGKATEYSASVCHRAIRDFITKLPNKENDFIKSIHFFAHSLYEKVSDENALYFLDKTPRYYFIIPEIKRTFPNAKFIFLFRNPLAILASVIETWGGGKLDLGSSYRDLYLGPKLLTKGYKLLKEESVRINYENLVKNPRKELEKIFAYLQLDFENSILAGGFKNSKLKGKMGDRNILCLKKIELSSLDKWKNVFNTKIRQWYAKKYLNQIDEEIFKTWGYNKKEILEELSQIRLTNEKIFSDIFDLVKINLLNLAEKILFRGKIKRIIFKKYFTEKKVFDYLG